MSIELKEFQTRTLDTLKEYLEKARLYGDPEQAFASIARTSDGRIPTYHKVPGLEHVPYVCLRLPTGGGKTMVGAYAIRVAAHSYIEKEYPVVLWLVPTNTIRTQTADALKNPAHSYRMALDEAFEGRVRVFDISEIENIRPADIAQNVCVVVATIQTLRAINALGLTTPKGHKVSPQTFDRLLRNELYAGWITLPKWNLREHGIFEPLVGEELFRRVQDILDGKRVSVTAHQRNNPDFPLRVFVSCGECGTPLTGA